MGSIVTYYKPKKWEIMKELDNTVVIQIGTTEDYDGLEPIYRKFSKLDWDLIKNNIQYDEIHNMGYYYAYLHGERITIVRGDADRMNR